MVIPMPPSMNDYFFRVNESIEQRIKLTQTDKELFKAKEQAAKSKQEVSKALGIEEPDQEYLL